MLIPATVISANVDGRKAWRSKMCVVGIPFALAVVMKSSRNVAIMSVRRTRVAPGPFPRLQSFPGDDCPPHFRTGPSHPHDRFG